jgi:3-dehydroquinate dehydratase
MKLRELRRGSEKWEICVLSGPGVSRELRAINLFDELIASWGCELGVHVSHFSSNHEGRLLEFIHATSERTNGYLVNPGGLASVGESLRHALRETERPVVAVHLHNASLNERSVFAPSVTGIFSGFQHFGYLGALLSLVLSLDDASFLGPSGIGVTNRSHGVPRSLYGR